MPHTAARLHHLPPVAALRAPPPAAPAGEHRYPPGVPPHPPGPSLGYPRVPPYPRGLPRIHLPYHTPSLEARAGDQAGRRLHGGGLRHGAAEAGAFEADPFRHGVSLLLHEEIDWQCVAMNATERRLARRRRGRRRRVSVAEQNGATNTTTARVSGRDPSEASAGRRGRAAERAKRQGRHVVLGPHEP